MSNLFYFKRISLQLNFFLSLLVFFGIIASIPKSTAQENDRRFRIGVSYFTNVDVGFSSPTLDTTTIGEEFSNSSSGINRSYDNGFVNIDSLGNDSNLTWNWGMSDPNPTIVDGDIAFTKDYYEVSGMDLFQEENFPGISVTLLPSTFELPKGGTLSIVGKIDISKVSSKTSYSLDGSATRIEDLYAPSFNPGDLLFPHTGSFEGPGPLLSDSPSRSTNATDVQFEGGMELDGRIIMLSIGGEFQRNLSDKTSAFIQADLLFGSFRGDFDTGTTLTMADGNEVKQSSSQKVSEIFTGASVGAGLAWKIKENSSVFLSVHTYFIDSLTGASSNGSFLLNLESGVQLTFGYQQLF